MIPCGMFHVKHPGRAEISLIRFYGFVNSAINATINAASNNSLPTAISKSHRVNG